MRTRCLIMKHNALKAKLHYDIRLQIAPDKWHSWRAIFDARKPFAVNYFKNRIEIIQTKDHTTEEAEFVGIIKEGEYGAGEITKIHDLSAYILKTGEKRYYSIRIDSEPFLNEKWFFYNVTKNKSPIWILYKIATKE